MQVDPHTDFATPDVPDGAGPPEPTDRKQGFPCELCGSALEYKPGSDTLHCKHCGHTQELKVAVGPAAAVQAYDFREGIAKARRQPASSMVKDGHTVQCEGCGAQSVVAGQASRCPFCGSPVVLATVELGEIFTPDSLLPFKLDARAAKASYQAWVGALWFAPNDLKKLAAQHGMDGVYLPYWAYDSRTTTRYTGERGEHYYVSESYTDSEGKQQTRQVQHTRWYPARGTVEHDFRDVLVCGSRSLPDKMIEALEPWDMPDLRAYDAGYLSGFAAERYKIGLEDGFKTAELKMTPEIRAMIERDIGGDVQRIGDMSIGHAAVRFKHLLLPLWISSFRYREKTFRVVINARTGEVAGERPWSVAKIVAAVVLAVMVILGIVWLTYARR